MFLGFQTLHFAGIGGIGMSGLAEIAQSMGCQVTGSDVAASATTQRLERRGIRVHVGHAAANLGDATALIVTSALAKDNPELLEAKRRGLPVVRRGEFLAELMRTRRGVAVGGSHGKTTTTAMVAQLAVDAGLDPTVVVGGRLPLFDGDNARFGGSDVLIAESDESDGSFLELSPVVSVITNIDREHLDHYRDLDEIREAFLKFANKPPFYGATIVCVDDANTDELTVAMRRRLVRYGRSEGADLRIRDVRTGPEGSRFSLTLGGEPMGEFQLGVLGEHNVSNATAAIAVGLELGLSAEVMRESLARYRGVARRLEIKGREQGITVVDDYGHHPTEIAATIAAARLARPDRLVVLFQPHRYTRTKELMEEFGPCFAGADLVRVADIYAASEPSISGVTAAALVERIQASGHRDVRWTGSLTGTVAHALMELRPGDLVVTMGAGSITQAGDLILKGLRKES